MPLIVKIILVLIVGIFVVFTFLWFYYGATGPAACALQKRKLLPDKCLGACAAGFVCINTGDRPYGPFGLGGTQHAICNCVPAAWAAGLSTPGGDDSDSDGESNQ